MKIKEQAAEASGLTYLQKNVQLRNGLNNWLRNSLNNEMEGETEKGWGGGEILASHINLSFILCSLLSGSRVRLGFFRSLCSSKRRCHAHFNSRSP